MISARILGIFAVALAILSATVSSARSQEVASPTQAASPTSTSDQPGVPIPTFRRIYFYESQSPRLVPSGFWPVTIEDLEAELARLAKREEQISTAPQLVSALYVARFENGALIDDTESTTLDIVYRGEGIASLPLRQVNLAFRAPSSGSALTAPARLVTDEDGATSVSLSESSRLRAGWSRSGRTLADASYDFDLRIPVCGRTRFLLGLPQQAILTTNAGVIQKLPNTPQEAFNVKQASELDWYSIELGGLNQVRMTIRPRSALGDEKRPTVIRSLGMECAVSPAKLDWTARMVVDLQANQSLPTLDLFGESRVTAVRIDNAAVPWKEVIVDSRTRLQLIDSNQAATPRSPTVVIEVSGVRAVREEQTSTIQTSVFHGRLPWLQVAGSLPIFVCSEGEMSLRLSEQLKIAEFPIQDGWRVLNREQAEQGSSVFRLAGPANQLPPSVRIVNSQALATCDAALKIRIEENTYSADWTATIQDSAVPTQPIELAIQPGWQIDTVNIIVGGRTTLPEDVSWDETRITLWPSSENLEAGSLRLQVQGRMVRTDGASDSIEVPEFWLLRKQDALNRCITAVVPPTDYEWDLDSTLAGQRVATSELTPADVSALGTLPVDTLLFRTDAADTPRLRLVRPLAAFSTELSVDWRIVNREVQETVRVAFKVPAGSLPQARIELGDRHNRPPMEWTIDDAENSSLASLTLNTRELTDADEGREIWELEPVGGIQDELVFVGRRRYPLNSLPPFANHKINGSKEVRGTSWTVDLPSVPSAVLAQTTQQRATITLGAGWEVLQTDPRILRVPHPINGPLSRNDSNSVSSAEGIAEANCPWQLRYDPTEPMAITLAIAEPSTGSNVIWEERLQILNNAFGQEIQSDYLMDGSQSLTIEFDPALTPTSVQGYTLPGTNFRQGKMIVAPLANSDSISIRWWQGRPANPWFDSFRTPQINAVGQVMRRDWRLWNTRDLCALHVGESAPPASWMPGEVSDFSVPVGPGVPVVFVSATVGWSIAISFACLLFGIGWYASQRAIWPIIAGLIPLALLSSLIPFWQTTILAFAILPLVCAALLETARRHLLKPMTLPKLSARKNSNQPLTGRAQRGSTNAVGAPRQRSLLWLGFLILNFPGLAMAQNPTESTASAGVASEPSPAPIMIPLNQDGQISGNKVYIPKSLYETLFRPQAPSLRTSPFSFLSADYQVRIAPSVQPDTTEQISVEALFRIDATSNSLPIRLPVLPSLLERLELIVEAAASEIRPLPDGNSVLVRLPRAGSHTLRATLRPPVEMVQSGSKRVQIVVPSIAHATVNVTSDFALDQLQVPGCLGQMVRSDSGNRLSATLGPVDRLEIVWQRAGTSSIVVGSKLMRRWWIHAGQESISRELEIDIADGVRAGAILLLDGAGGPLPTVTSPNWSLIRVESNDTGRERLRLSALVDAPGPVRLLWSSAMDNLSETGVTLEDVKPMGYTGDIETLLAVDAPAEWQIEFVAPNSAVQDAVGSSTGVSPLVAPPTTNLDISTFLSGWRGFRGTIREAFRYSNAALPILRFKRTSNPTSQIAEVHRVDIDTNCLRVMYRANIEILRSNHNEWGVRFPKEFNLERVSLDGIPTQVTRGVLQDSSQELLIPDIGTKTSTELLLVGTLPVQGDASFALPKIKFTGGSVSTSRYVLNRANGLSVKELSSPEEENLPITAADFDLSSGVVPLRHWNLQQALTTNSLFLDARYAVSRKELQFQTRSLTTLRWEDGGWNLEAIFDIVHDQPLRDLVVFQVPASWIDGINVSSAVKWSSQPTADPEFFWIRVMPQGLAQLTTPQTLETSAVPESASPLRLRLTSRLSNPDEGGISIPQIRVVGEISGEHFLAAPKRLTNSPIQWQTQFAQPCPAPLEFAPSIPDESTHSFLKVLSNTFVATLRNSESSDEMTADALLEVSLFRQEANSVLALQRLFVVPGNRQAIEFDVPSGCRVLGIWSGGTLLNSRLDPVTGRLVVPVGYSRLAQQFCILTSTPIGSESEVLRLPTVRELRVLRSWYSCYGKGLQSLELPSTGSEIAEFSGWTPLPLEEFQTSLAAGLLSLLDGTIDNVAERSTLEKRLWIQPWLARLQRLGCEVPQKDAVGNEPIGDATTAKEANIPLMKLLQQVFGGDVTGQLNQTAHSSGRWLLAPTDWSPSATATYSGNLHRIPAAFLPAYQPLTALTDRMLLFAWMSMAVFVLCTAILLKTGDTRLRNPALWLFLFGVCSLPLVPIPISITTMLAAVLSPWLSR